MNARKQRALLDALTPEIRAYLFPGWSPISMHCRQVSFDLADEAEIRAVPAQEVKFRVASRSRMAAKTSSAPKEEPDRNVLRRKGRKVMQKNIGTTLLTKGLEFDNVVILNAQKFDDPRHFYVALTRCSEKLVVISITAVLHPYNQ